MDRPKRNARKDILSTAERLFTERGIENVSLRTINARAVYSAAALRYHFKTREVLLRALMIERLQPVMEARAALIGSLGQSGQPTATALAEALVMPFARLIEADHERGLTTI